MNKINNNNTEVEKWIGTVRIFAGFKVFNGTC